MNRGRHHRGRRYRTNGPRRSPPVRGVARQREEGGIAAWWATTDRSAAELESSQFPTAAFESRPEYAREVNPCSTVLPAQVRVVEAPKQHKVVEDVAREAHFFGAREPIDEFADAPLGGERPNPPKSLQPREQATGHQSSDDRA